MNVRTHRSAKAGRRLNWIKSNISASSNFLCWCGRTGTRKIRGRRDKGGCERDGCPPERGRRRGGGGANRTYRVWSTGRELTVSNLICPTRTSVLCVAGAKGEEKIRRRRRDKGGVGVGVWGVGCGVWGVWGAEGRGQRAEVTSHSQGDEIRKVAHSERRNLLLPNIGDGAGRTGRRRKERAPREKGAVRARAASRPLELGLSSLSPTGCTLV